MAGQRVTKSPMFIQLHLTRRCNLDCYYCGADELVKKETEPELDTKEWIDLLLRLKDIQVFDVSFTGGEIFLRKDIFEILETAVTCKFPKMRLTTNGVLIGDAAAKGLKRLNFKNVEISLDGDKEAHDRLRGAGSFDKSIDGIKHLINNDIIPVIRLTPLKSNYKTLNGLVDILYSLGIGSLIFNSLKTTGKCTGIYKDIMLHFIEDTEELGKIIGTIRAKYPGFKISDPDTFYKNLPRQYHEYKNKQTPYNMNKQKLKSCSAAHSSCNITAGGWVIPCSELVDFKAGNIREQDILDTWGESGTFAGIRDLCNVSTDQIPCCRDCDYNLFCDAGCRANAYAVYGDLKAPDPFCPYQDENRLKIK